MKTIYLVLITTILILSVNARSIETDYTNTMEKQCENGACNMKIYNSPRFVKENKEWIPIEKAKKLDDKNIFKIKTKTDQIHGFDVVFFNYTCIELQPYAVDFERFEYGQDIPIKVDGTEHYKIKVPNVLSSIPTITLCFEDNVLNHNYTFGKESTTVAFEQEDGGWLYDTNCDNSTINSYPASYIYSGTYYTGSGALYQGFMSFDTSDISPDDEIVSASINVYIDYETFESADSVTLYNCSFYPFTVEDWNTETDTSLHTYYGSELAVGNYINTSIGIGTIVPESRTDFCVYWDDVCADTSDIVQMGSGSPNYLEIEYNEGGEDTTPPTVDFIDPTNSNSTLGANVTTINWNMSVSEDAGLAKFEINGTNQTATCVNATTSTYCYYDESGLSGNVSRCAFAHASDGYNNWASDDEYICINTNEQQEEAGEGESVYWLYPTCYNRRTLNASSDWGGMINGSALFYNWSYVNGANDADMSDLRFGSYSSNISIDHWTWRYDDSYRSWGWVEVDDDVVFAYFNCSDSGTSNETETFEWADMHSGSSVDWTLHASTDQSHYSESGGLMTMTQVNPSWSQGIDTSYHSENISYFAHVRGNDSSTNVLALRATNAQGQNDADQMMDWQNNNNKMRHCFTPADCNDTAYEVTEWVLGEVSIPSSGDGMIRSKYSDSDLEQFHHYSGTPTDRDVYGQLVCFTGGPAYADWEAMTEYYGDPIPTFTYGDIENYTEEEEEEPSGGECWYYSYEYRYVPWGCKYYNTEILTGRKGFLE